jgi:putative phosphoribosyl transferase
MNDLTSANKIEWAIAALRDQGAASITVAVPLLEKEARRELSQWADQVACLAMPENLVAIRRHYTDFTDTSDQTACYLLESAANIPRTIAPPAAA